MRILVLNGPNLNLLGRRQPEIYGTRTLQELMFELEAYASRLGVQVTPRQSNSEGALIDAIHDAAGWAQGIIINPAAYTHYSYALRDAIAAVDLPTVEVHLSDISAREPWRRHSVTAEVCIGQIAGEGSIGYHRALDMLLHEFRKKEATKKGMTSEQKGAGRSRKE
jgi:3-dehydroquinate dehydratase II